MLKNLFPLLLLIVVLPGCVGAPGGPSGTGALPSAIRVDYREMHLSFGEVYVRQAHAAGGKVLAIEPFFAVQAGLSALAMFDAVERMDPRQLYRFVRALSAGLPALAAPIPTTHLGDIVVGGIVNDDDPLVLEKYLADPAILRDVHGEAVLYLVSNIGNSRSLGRQKFLVTGRPLNTTVNWTFIALVKDGRLVTKLSARAADVDPAAPALERITAAVGMIKDDDPRNDALIPGLLEPIVQDPAAEPSTRAAAMLTLFLQRLSVGRYEEARALLDQARGLLSPGRDPRGKAATALAEAETTYRLTRALAEDDERWLDGGPAGTVDFVGPAEILAAAFRGRLQAVPAAFRPPRE
jgi:hypothetical protein